MKINFFSPVTDHESSDDCGVNILGKEETKFWHDHKGAKINAIRVTINFPIIADGTKLIFFADLIMTAPTASPVAQTKPRKFPKKSQASKAS